MSARPALSFRASAVIGSLVLFLLYAGVHQKPGWNQNSRLDLLHALVLQHRFAIDTYQANTGDRARFRGHYFSEKAPGTVAMALPSFFVLAKALRAFGINVDEPRPWWFSDWLTTALSIGLLTALSAAAFLATLRRFVDPRTALLTTGFLFIGAGFFPFATMLFSHAAAGACVAVALYPLLKPDDGSLNAFWAAAMAGFFCGWAVASEFEAAIPAIGVGLYAFYRWRGKSWSFFAAAALPLSLILINNAACFDGPLRFGYLGRTNFPQMHHGFFGLSFPKLRALHTTLFADDHGLFFWSPFLLLCGLGYRRLRLADPALFWLLFGVPLAHEIVMSGYFLPGGGACLGPRYLVCVLPFLGLATGIGAREFPRAALVLGWISIVLTGICTMVDALPEEVFVHPILQLFLPRIAEGKFAANVGSLIGVNPYFAAILPPLLAGAVWHWLASRARDSDRAG